MVASHTAPPGRRLIVLHQYSDFWCPWCYIGYREINAAIDRCRQEKLPVDFQIEYKPYILQPSLSADHGVDRVELFSSKLGQEKTSMLLKLVGDRGKTLGIDRVSVHIISFLLSRAWLIDCLLHSKCGPVRSTMRAHRLMLLAYKHGGARLQADTCQRLFYAFTEEEKDLGDPLVLADLAAELNILPRDRVRRRPSAHR